MKNLLFTLFLFFSFFPWKAQIMILESNSEEELKEKFHPTDSSASVSAVLYKVPLKLSYEYTHHCFQLVSRCERAY